MNKQEIYVMAFGDVDIENGALFIKDEGHSAEIVEVEECPGATDMIIVSQGNVSIEDAGSTLAAMRDRFRSALKSHGMYHEPESRWTITGMTRQWARLMAYQCMWSHGYGDRMEQTVLATSKLADGGSDNWKPSGRVNGERGLWRWLARKYDIDPPEEAVSDPNYPQDIDTSLDDLNALPPK